MIRELHECLAEEFHGGAFAWADRTFDDAWTKAVNRFEAAMVVAFKQGDFELFQTELTFYKTKTLDLFNRYKEFNSKADVATYLENLKNS